MNEQIYAKRDWSNPIEVNEAKSGVLHKWLEAPTKFSTLKVTRENMWVVGELNDCIDMLSNTQYLIGVTNAILMRLQSDYGCSEYGKVYWKSFMNNEKLRESLNAQLQLVYAVKVTAKKYSVDDKRLKAAITTMIKHVRSRCDSIAAVVLHTSLEITPAYGYILHLQENNRTIKDDIEDNAELFKAENGIYIYIDNMLHIAKQYNYDYIAKVEELLILRDIKRRAAEENKAKRKEERLKAVRDDNLYRLNKEATRYSRAFATGNRSKRPINWAVYREFVTQAERRDGSSYAVLVAPITNVRSGRVQWLVDCEGNYSTTAQQAAIAHGDNELRMVLDAFREKDSVSEYRVIRIR